ncbi:MAG: hypothetical protein JXR47_07040 [Thiotrichales bacterium]|nr:hypothetical protein [Thiotrichales bacterium]
MSVIADNWSLQNIAEMMVNGLDDEITHYVDVDFQNNSFSYKDVSHSAITVETFFDFITDIILRNQIVVDSNFSSSWKSKDSLLSKPFEAGLIREFSFLDEPDRLKEPRDEFLKRLCVTEGITQAHIENTVGWQNHRQTPHPFLSQILWGGAGMLARSLVFEKGYTPHPIRKKLFLDSGFALPANTAVNTLTTFINEKRASLQTVNTDSSELFSLQVNLPPIPLKVIREANSVDDLITVAMQMRDEFSELRGWLGAYQNALSDGTYRDEKKFENIIKSVSLYIDSFMGKVDSNAPTFTAGIGVLKVSIKGRPINALQNQFGVRSMMNKLVLERSGDAELRKFLGFFGHRNSTIGLQVIEHFTK